MLTNHNKKQDMQANLKLSLLFVMRFRFLKPNWFFPYYTVTSLSDYCSVRNKEKNQKNFQNYLKMASVMWRVCGLF